MPKRDTHRVLPDGDKWKVQRDGDSKASHVTERKQDAVNIGREISRNQGTEFTVHKQDGTIQSSDSHGNDPYPPKG